MQGMSLEQQRLRVLASVSRSRLLTVLRASDRPMGIAELAAAVGLHPNTTREHLDQLVRVGIVRRETAPAAGRGRPGLRYSAVPDEAVADRSAPYRSLAAVLAAELADRSDTADASIGAGERWGRTAVQATSGERSAAVDVLVGLLDEIGFEPERTSDGEIRLRPCPFGSLARERGEVVCNVHLGLMRGALRELDAPVDAIGLVPFVEPNLCLAHIGPRHAG